MGGAARLRQPVAERRHTGGPARRDIVSRSAGSLLAPLPIGRGIADRSRPEAARRTPAEPGEAGALSPRAGARMC